MLLNSIQWEDGIFASLGVKKVFVNKGGKKVKDNPKPWLFCYSHPTNKKHQENSIWPWFSVNPERSGEVLVSTLKAQISQVKPSDHFSKHNEK